MIAKMNQIPSHLHQSWPHEALQTERREKFLHCDAFYKRKCPRVWLKITFKRWPHLAFFLSLSRFSLLSTDSHLRFQSRTFLNYCTLSRAQAAPRSSRVGQLTPAPASLRSAQRCRVQWIMQQPDKFCSLNIEMRGAKQTYTSTYVSSLLFSRSGRYVFCLKHNFLCLGMVCLGLWPESHTYCRSFLVSFHLPLYNHTSLGRKAKHMEDAICDIMEERPKED